MKEHIEKFEGEQVFIINQKGFYEKFVKRGMDFILSLIALIVLSPFLLILTIIGIFAMKGNPFFLQDRPGKNEKIFKLIKFRTMKDKKDQAGKLMPDESRLTPYGKFLRKTSLDELPELFNILIGQLAICGPRPLLTAYLDRYNDYQKHRHDVRPGLTGYAQVHGRNALSWEEKFEMDIKYVNNITFFGDVKIIFQTVLTVLKCEGISSKNSSTMEEFKGNRDE